MTLTHRVDTWHTSSFSSILGHRHTLSNMASWMALAQQQLFGLSYKSQLFMTLFQWLTDVNNGASSNVPLSPKKVAAVIGLAPQVGSEAKRILDGLRVKELIEILELMKEHDTAQILRKLFGENAIPVGAREVIGVLVDMRGSLLDDATLEQVQMLLDYVPPDTKLTNLQDQIEGLLQDTGILRRVFGPYPLAAATTAAVYFAIITGVFLLVLGVVKGVQAARRRQRRKVNLNLSDPRVIIVIACTTLALSAGMLLTLAPKLLQLLASLKARRNDVEATPAPPPPQTSSAFTRWWNWFFGRK